MVFSTPKGRRIYGLKMTISIDYIMKNYFDGAKFYITRVNEESCTFWSNINELGKRKSLYDLLKTAKKNMTPNLG